MNPNESESRLALFIDYDNIALGSKGRTRSKKRFPVQPVMDRLLEKGKIVVKKAYADWSEYGDAKDELHSAGIELIEIPKPKISGKNSADIRMVVDALELSYAKEHIDTFVILSGDSDLAPLVSKLRENRRFVIGMGLKEATSHRLLEACDEFIFVEDLEVAPPPSSELGKLPKGKETLFKLLIATVQAVIREGRDVVYASHIKDTMKRKAPSFNESAYGYATFGDLLEDAAEQGLIQLGRDERAGGTFVVRGLGRKAKGR